MKRTGRQKDIVTPEKKQEQRELLRLFSANIRKILKNTDLLADDLQEIRLRTGAPLLVVILTSWGIALFEYMLRVPANRIGHGYFSAAELKTIQEVITLFVFGVFSVFFLKEPLTWNHIVGFGFIALGAFFIFHRW